MRWRTHLQCCVMINMSGDNESSDLDTELDFDLNEVLQVDL